jgi:quinol-cytochrome oxidoreductase complex cytochrome b subunit
MSQSFSRPGVRSTFVRLLRRPVHKGSRSLAPVGWLILLLFSVQIVTGILLSLYYEAAPEMAYESIKFIMRDVSGGWLVRGIHYWAAEGMIALGVIQLARVFFTAAYKGLGRTSWLIGLFLLILTFGFAFTGGLLIWDQQAYWSAQIGLQWIEGLPLVGPLLATILRGGPDVSASTLSRFYSIHTLLLPWLMFYLLLPHLWLLHRRSTLRAEARDAA